MDMLEAEKTLCSLLKFWRFEAGAIVGKGNGMGGKHSIVNSWDSLGINIGICCPNYSTMTW